LITLAVTPSFLALIVLANPLKVLLLLSTVISVLVVPTVRVRTPLWNVVLLLASSSV
jgi:hypothetical protein